ncbi:MAG: DinB family protein [Gemmatimonadota bacterium]
MALAEVTPEVTAPAEPELTANWRRFGEQMADADALVAPLSAEQLTWRPAPDRWSVADCLNHLNVTAEKYLPRIEQMVARGREEELESRGPFRHPFVGTWFVRMLEPPPRRRLRVPGVFAPLPGVEPAALLPEFLRLRTRLRNLVRDADGLDLARLKTSSPAARFFTLTLGQCFGALAAHDRRHLWQARQVANHPDFPRQTSQS